MRMQKLVSVMVRVIGKMRNCGMRNAEGKMRNDLLTNRRRSAFFIPHFTLRVPHSTHSQWLGRSICDSEVVSSIPGLGAIG